MALLLSASSIPGDDSLAPAGSFTLELLPSGLQNLLHVPAFAVLAFAWWQVLRGRSLGLIAMATVSVGLTVGFAGLDEWHQTHVPGRYGNLTDLALDVLGAFLGTLAGYCHAGQTGNQKSR